MAKLTYKEAYLKLQELSNQINELDLSEIDKLVGITEKANKYISVCEDRIKIIRGKLENIPNAEQNGQ
jgi:uncharacterized protein involved in exopolysaccharide biosynthesis